MIILPLDAVVCCLSACLKIIYLALSFQPLWISVAVLPIFYSQLCGSEDDAAAVLR
jgi:hypothetical protein